MYFDTCIALILISFIPPKLYFDLDFSTNKKNKNLKNIEIQRSTTRAEVEDPRTITVEDCFWSKYRKGRNDASPQKSKSGN